MNLNRKRMLEDDAFDKESEQHPDGLGVNSLSLCFLCAPASQSHVIGYSRPLCFCEVYSKSIRARASYLAADEKALALHDIDPHDSIEVLYTPAMRRIRHGILQMDPPARSRFAPFPTDELQSFLGGVRCRSQLDERAENPSHRTGPLPRPGLGSVAFDRFFRTAKLRRKALQCWGSALYKAVLQVSTSCRTRRKRPFGVSLLSCSPT